MTASPRKSSFLTFLSNWNKSAKIHAEKLVWRLGDKGTFWLFLVFAFICFATYAWVSIGFNLFKNHSDLPTTELLKETVVVIVFALFLPRTFYFLKEALKYFYDEIDGHLD